MTTIASSHPAGAPGTQKLRAGFSPRLLLSELLLKQWFEPVIPFLVMLGLAAYFCATIPGYATLDNAQSMARLFVEFGFVALAMDRSAGCRQAV